MKTLAIYDRQPLLRLGLQLLIGSHYPSLCLREICSLDELSTNNRLDDVSIIILGLDLEYDMVNRKVIRNIHKKFPRAHVIIYADPIDDSRVLSYLDQDIAAYVSKQASEAEFLGRLHPILENKKHRLKKAKSADSGLSSLHEARVVAINHIL